MEKTAIVVLGAPNDANGVLSSIAVERCRQAVAEFQRQPGSWIIPTGGWGAHFNTTARPHGQYQREYLLAHGIPGEAIVEGAESTNTIEDARLCRPIVERHGFRQLIVVTSDFHLARARYLFTREFPRLALSFQGSATHLPEDELRQRIAHEQQALAKLQQGTSL